MNAYRTNDHPTEDYLGDDYLAAPGQRTGAHPLSTAHLVIGVVFLALAGAWVIAASGVVSAESLRWLLPLPFVLGGATGLIALALTARNRGTGRR